MLSRVPTNAIPAREGTVSANADDAATLEPVSLSGFEGTRDEWSPLAERAGNLFSTWEWASTWWSHFGRGDLQLTGCRRRDGSLAGILPLYLSSSGPLRVVRLVGHGPADQLGPICALAERERVADALRRTLSGHLPRWDIFLGERLPCPERWDDLLAAGPVRRESSPTLSTADMSWEDFLASRSANFRQQVRRRERRLIRDHSIRFRLSDDPSCLDRDLDSLFRLHTARWSAQDSGSFAEDHSAFHRSFAKLALERGWLRLWLAEADGRAVAAWYGFRFANADWYYQAGRDPAWDQTSVGAVLFALTVREAMRDGMQEYKLLLGDEPYKARFTQEDPGVETVALAGGAVGRWALTGARYLRRFPASRRLLSRASRSQGLVD